MDVFVLNTQEVSRLTSSATRLASFCTLDGQESCLFLERRRPDFLTRRAGGPSILEVDRKCIYNFGNQLMLLISLPISGTQPAQSFYMERGLDYMPNNALYLFVCTLL